MCLLRQGEQLHRINEDILLRGSYSCVKQFNIILLFVYQFTTYSTNSFFTLKTLKARKRKTITVICKERELLYIPI
jgi:hypothetical protein